MPIHNSKVSSAELFAKRRARRLKRAQPDDDGVADPTSGQGGPVDSEPIGPDEDTQRPLGATEESNSTRGEPATIEPEGQGGPTEIPGDTTRDDEPNASEDPPQSAIKRQSNGSRKRQSEKSDRAGASQRKETGPMKLHMRLAVPAPGASPTFDQLVEMHGEQPAFRLVLGKALELFAASVVDGRSGEAPLTYPESSKVIATARNIPKSAYAILTEEMNPKGLVSHRMMGTAIGRRALAAFVADDKKQG